MGFTTSGAVHCVLLQVEVTVLDEGWLEAEIRVYSSVKEVGNLASPANFARLYLHRLFPHLRRVLYLDADVLMRGDVRELWQRLATSKQLLLAVPR